MSLRNVFAGLIAAVGVLVTGTAANAAFTVDIYGNAHTTAVNAPAALTFRGSVSDFVGAIPPATGDQNGLANAITFDSAHLAFSVPGFTIDGELSLTNLPGTNVLSFITNNLTVTRIANSGSPAPAFATIEFLVTATGFTKPAGSKFLRQTGSASRLSGGGSPTITYESKAIGTTTVTTGTQTLTPVSGSSAFGFLSTPGVPFAGNPYTVISRIRVTSGGVGTKTLVSQVTQVADTPFGPTPTPEPGSIALMLLGGMGLVGGAVRRRRAKTA